MKFSQFLNEYVILGNSKSDQKLGLFRSLTYFNGNGHLILGPIEGAKVTISLKKSVKKSIATSLISLCQMHTDPFGTHKIDDQLADYYEHEPPVEMFDLQSDTVSGEDLKKLIKQLTTKSVIRGLHLFQKLSNGYKLNPSAVILKLDAPSVPELDATIISTTSSALLEIDPAEKTVSIGNHEKSWQSRIGKLSASGSLGKTHYSIPTSDATLGLPEARKVCASLIKKDNNYKSYTFVEFLTGGQNRSVNLHDFVQHKDPETAPIIKSTMAVKMNLSGPIIAFHGTSMAKWKKIKKEGLKYGVGPDYNDKIKGHSEYNVYLTTDLADARKYAVRAAGSGVSVVLEVTIPDNAKIVFDEDALGRVNKKVENLIKKKYGNIDLTTYLREKGAYEYNVGYGGYLNYHDWARASAASETAANDPITKDILKLYALFAAGHGELFAYRGNIAPRYLKIRETFSSEKVDDNKPDPDLPERVRKSIKRET